MVLYPFANIHWWNSWIKNPNFIDTASLNYAKNQSYNKYSIMNANGILDLSIPIANGRNQRIPFNQIPISYSEDWQGLQWKSLIASYNNSAFFEFYNYKLEPLFLQKFEYLYEFNYAAFEIIRNILQIKQSNHDVLTLNEIINKDNLEYIIHNKKFSLNNSEYYQVFSNKLSFQPNLSILDLIFNEGNNSITYLKSI